MWLCWKSSPKVGLQQQQQVFSRFNLTTPHQRDEDDDMEMDAGEGDKCPSSAGSDSSLPLPRKLASRSGAVTRLHQVCIHFEGSK